MFGLGFWEVCKRDLPKLTDFGHLFLFRSSEKKKITTWRNNLASTDFNGKNPVDIHSTGSGLSPVDCKMGIFHSVVASLLSTRTRCHLGWCFTVQTPWTGACTHFLQTIVWFCNTKRFHPRAGLKREMKNHAAFEVSSSFCSLIDSQILNKKNSLIFGNKFPK